MKHTLEVSKAPSPTTSSEYMKGYRLGIEVDTIPGFSGIHISFHDRWQMTSSLETWNKGRSELVARCREASHSAIISTLVCSTTVERGPSQGITCLKSSLSEHMHTKEDGQRGALNS